MVLIVPYFFYIILLQFAVTLTKIIIILFDKHHFLLLCIFKTSRSLRQGTFPSTSSGNEGAPDKLRRRRVFGATKVLGTSTGSGRHVHYSDRSLSLSKRRYSDRSLSLPKRAICSLSEASYLLRYLSLSKVPFGGMNNFRLRYCFLSSYHYFQHGL